MQQPFFFAGMGLEEQLASNGEAHGVTSAIDKRVDMLVSQGAHKMNHSIVGVVK